MAISYDEFKKVEMKIGKVISCEKIEASEKLYLLKVNFGEEEAGLPAGRQVVSGLAKFYAPEDLIGREFPFITNLEPRQLMGYESQGMLLATSIDDQPVLLVPDKEVPPGTGLR